MSRIMSNLVLALSILLVDICNGETPANLTCDKLPKVPIPNVEVLISNSPFKFDYTLTATHDCSSKVITHPARGSAHYDGTVMTIRGSYVHVKDFYYDSDQKGAAAINCTTGEKMPWYLSAAHFDDNGAFYCTYTCDGKALKEFTCVSNNNGTSPAELEAFNMAKTVPNGHRIHKAWENCPPSKGCNTF